MVHKVHTLDQHTPRMHPEICKLWPHSWQQPAASQLAPHSLLSQSSSEDLHEYRLCLWFGALFMPFGLAHACSDFDSGYLPAFLLSLASTLLPGTHNPTPSAVLWQGLVCLPPGKVHTPPVDSSWPISRENCLIHLKVQYVSFIRPFIRPSQISSSNSDHWEIPCFTLHILVFFFVL